MQDKNLQQVDFTPADKEIVLSHALEKIKLGKMKELDPTLGDQGCHLRACPLVFIAGKVLDSQELTEDEKTLLIALETIMASSADINAQNGFFLLNKSYSYKLPAYIKTKYSRNQKIAIVSHYRVLASKLSMDFLAEKVGRLPDTDLFRELKTSFENDTKTVSRDKEELKVIPVYLALRLIVEILMKEGLPIVLTVQQYKLLENGEAIQLENATPLLYEANPERTGYVLSQETESTKPALCFQIFTMYDSEENKLSLNEFVAKIRALDLQEVFITFPALHDQYPRIMEEDKLASYEKEESTGLLKEAYEKSCKLGKAMNVTAERLNKKLSDSVTELTNQRLFQGTHIYCTDYNTEFNFCEQLSKEEVLSTKVIVNLDQNQASYQNH